MSEKGRNNTNNSSKKRDYKDNNSKPNYKRFHSSSTGPSENRLTGLSDSVSKLDDVSNRPEDANEGEVG